MVGVLLGESDGAISVKKDIAAEEIIGNGGRTHRESNELVYARGSDHTCRQDVRGFSVISVFDDFGGTRPKESAREASCFR